MTTDRGDNSALEQPESARAAVSDPSPARVQEASGAERDPNCTSNKEPGAPLVTYRDGLVTVHPKGALLKDVLRAIGVQTGVALDLPVFGLETRLYDEQIGPISVRELMPQLLYGSGYSYIIQTASNDGTKVMSVVVSGRSQKPGDVAQAPGAPHASPGEDEMPEPTAYGGVSDPSAEEEQPIVAVSPSPSTGPAPNVPGIPENFNLQEAAAQAHKTPGEILADLQKRQLEILKAQAPPPQ